LEFLAWLEANSLAGRNRNFGARAGVPADAGLARPDVEDAKAAKLNAFSTTEGSFHTLEDGFDGHLGLRLRDPSSIDNFVDDIGFYQETLLDRPAA
jgi:hypothetical protein